MQPELMSVLHLSAFTTFTSTQQYYRMTYYLFFFFRRMYYVKSDWCKDK